MTQTPRKYRLCELDDIEPGTSKGFEINIVEEQQVLEIFVVRDPGHSGSDIYCYLNQCPHTQANLNWMPDQFLSLEKSHIQCALHGALFRIQDGFCVWGPCKGASLQPVEVVLEDTSVFVKIT